MSEARESGGSAALVLGGFLALGAAGLLSSYEGGADVDMSRARQLPSRSHPLGTDWLGRDLLSRIVAGTRSFFGPGVLAASLAVGLGVPLGALAGYRPPSRRGAPPLVGESFYAALDLALSLPSALPRFVTLVFCCVTWGFTPQVLAAAAGVLYAAELGEEIRARVRQCAQEEWVESARAEGYSTARILGRHILLLHCRTMILRHALNVIAFVILVETSLSFMPGDFGVQEPAPSWGNMLVGAQDAVLGGDPWPAFVPTAFLVATVVLLGHAGDTIERTPSAARVNEEESRDGA